MKEPRVRAVLVGKVAPLGRRRRAERHRQAAARSGYRTMALRATSREPASITAASKRRSIIIPSTTTPGGARNCPICQFRPSAPSAKTFRRSARSRRMSASVTCSASAPRASRYRRGASPAGGSMSGSGCPTWRGRVQETGRTGWYYRVLEEGEVGVGNPIRLVDRPAPEWTLANVADVLCRNVLSWSGRHGTGAWRGARGVAGAYHNGVLKLQVPMIPWEHLIAFTALYCRLCMGGHTVKAVLSR